MKKQHRRKKLHTSKRKKPHTSRTVEKRVITRAEFDSGVKAGRERGAVALAMHPQVGPLLEVLGKSRELMRLRLWREGEGDSAEAIALLREMQELLRQAKAAEWQ